MTELNEAIKNILLPPRMRRLPISKKGFVIPWFVYIDENGVEDFRVIGKAKFSDALRARKCWLCGEPLGTWYAFVVGPMCIINRVSAEPPSHLECAEYAVAACPFLTNPRMRRNEKDLPADGVEPGGIMLRRNPGATAILMTRSYRPFRVGEGALIQMGEPERVLWFAEGRKAERDEVMASITSGLPLLEREAAKDGRAGLAALEQAYKRAQQWLPAA